jgi:hypothetical protein
MKNQAAWIVALIAGGVLLYAFSSSAAGGLTITVAAGVLTGIKSPSSGRVVLVLPSGATWLSGQVSSGTLTPKALPVPGGQSGSLTIQVLPGVSYAFQWNDATGTTQNTFLVFA